MNNKARVREYFDLMFTSLENTYNDVVKKIKPSKGYLDRLMSLDRFKKQGDIYQFQHESIVAYLNSL